MKKPKWQKKFRNLPEIPTAKHWIKDEANTLEQQITLKLITGQQITEEETNIVEQLIFFYGSLYNELAIVDFENFTEKDFENFKNYIFYAFNYLILLSNKVVISQVFRVVVNRDKKSITKKSLLSYPPLHVVKKLNKYNRVNTPNTNVFYCSETINTALNEIKPKVGDIVTVSIWEPIDKNRTFNSYPISHGANAYGVNPHATNAMNAVNEFKKKTNKLFSRFIDPYFHLLGREFEKPINHHYEYLLSAMFSEKIFENNKRADTGFDFECITYPSVGNKFTTSNIAFRKDIIRHHFKLAKVVEFEVASEHYDRAQSLDPFTINLVAIKNIREAKSIIDNEIIWE
ncbi:hypothetical protein HX038_08100 [Myroides odoratimimus]|uniref:hypothetical protein n=1 Tax=Myroides odoratimimus TaxID=76832 RepID=UPI002577ADE1|nr:hypothetical protein [Myroides odoratimimus]MDM1410716.1 hypothetical protein [Myroides odoratimimus]